MGLRADSSRPRPKSLRTKPRSSKPRQEYGYPLICIYGNNACKNCKIIHLAMCIYFFRGKITKSQFITQHFITQIAKAVGK